MSRTNEPITVNAPNYTAKFYRRTIDSFYMLREVRHESVHYDFDVFGQYWVFSWGYVGERLISAKRDGRKIPIEGNICTFLPPFSAVNWILQPGEFQFHTLLSSAALPPDLPREPITWSETIEHGPETPEEAFSIVRAAKNCIPMSPCSRPHAFARRAKAWIDAHYAGNILMEEMEESLGASQTVIGRLFKKNYGIGPVAYRNRLRVSDSLRLILFSDQPLATTAYEVGFGDLSRYNRNFRKEMKSKPSSFR